MLHLFNSSLLAPNEGDSELSKSIKTTIMTYLNDKYSDPSTGELLDIASFVDPRFKAKYIQSGSMEAEKQKAETESYLRSKAFGFWQRELWG